MQLHWARQAAVDAERHAQIGLRWAGEFVFKCVLLQFEVCLSGKDTVEFSEEILGFRVFFLFNMSNALLLFIHELRVTTQLNQCIPTLIDQVICQIAWHIFQKRNIDGFVVPTSLRHWLILRLKLSMQSPGRFCRMNSLIIIPCLSYHMMGVSISQSTKEFILVMLPIMHRFRIFERHIS